MKYPALFRDKGGSFQDILKIYRKHAARALAEERWSIAEIFFDRILDIAPRHTEAWLMKGFLRQHCRADNEAALQCFRKVISLCGHDPNHPHVQRARRSVSSILRSWGA